ncbi:MAG: LapA family protein [Cardiobacteriaceae bacterium]|nr:LapA family protein [Cardiobacteriaceae bacterium]
MKWINLLLALALGVLFAVLAIFNDHMVQVDYLLGKGEVALVMVLLGGFLSGALLTLLIFGVKATYWKSRAMALHHQLSREHRDADYAEIEAQFRADHQSA